MLARYWTAVDGNDSSHSSGCPAVLAFSAPDHRAAGDLGRGHVLFVIFLKRGGEMCPKNVRNANSLHATVAHVLPGEKKGGTEAAQDKRKVCERALPHAPITAARGVNVVPVTTT